MVRKVTSINNMYKGKFPIWNRQSKIKLMAPRFVRIALNKNILMNISLHKKALNHVSTLGLIVWSSIMSISINSLRILGLINSITTWHRLHEVQTSSVSTLGIDNIYICFCFFYIFCFIFIIPIWNRNLEIKLLAPRFVRIALNKNILTNISLHKKASTPVSTLGSTAWSSIMSIGIEYLHIIGLIKIVSN